MPDGSSGVPCASASRSRSDDRMKTTFRLTAAALVLATFNVSAATLYVSLDSPSPMPPYTNWAAATHVIQDAVDAAQAGDTVLVTNGVYANGGRTAYGLMTNRVVVDKPLTLTSVNGPEVTVIQGYQVLETTNGDGAIRCLYLTNGAVLSGFTLTNGATRSSGDDFREQSGGGFWCESSEALVTNCILAGNSAAYEGGGAAAGTLNHCTLTANVAHTGGGASGGILNHCTLTGNSAQEGGGVYGGTLLKCLLVGNSAYAGGAASEGTMDKCLVKDNSAHDGGGASWCDLNDCTLTGNSATSGGGVVWSGLNNCTLTGNSATEAGGGALGGSLNNCIVYSNTADVGSNYFEGTLQYSCTTPMPTNGVGNITNAPAFLNATAGDFHLQSNSPCVNAGRNAYARDPTDLDGNPRIVNGTVDIGAYEYQGIGSVISYAWLQQYGLPTDGSADYVDSDADGMNNWQEYLADTSPVDAKDCLRITSLTRSGTYNTLWWASKSTRLYEVQRRAALDASSAWDTIITNSAPGWNNVGFDNMGPQYFYRVGAVQPWSR
jgi:hypothetical protein